MLFVLIEPGVGGAHGFAQFGFAGAGFGGTEFVGVAGFDFDEVKDAVFLGDAIDLAEGVAPVVMEDVVAVFL